MNKEKQKIIADICPFYKEYGSCDRCNTETEIDDPPCYFECMANAIIDNNYRKQSEGEWVKFRLSADDTANRWKCSVCKSEQHEETDYCPNCGAKMKGGAE